MSYRNASSGFSGGLEMQLIDSLGNTTVLNQANFTSTGGWQTWQTTNTSEVFWLDKGVYHIRLLITNQEFNLNWFEFNVVAGLSNREIDFDVKIFPNPTEGIVNLNIDTKNANTFVLKVFNQIGEILITRELKNTNNIKESLDLSEYSNGIYFVSINSNKGRVVKKVVLNN